jgi:hypothetical protein
MRGAKTIEQQTSYSAVSERGEEQPRTNVFFLTVWILIAN